jgi:hypothetical protein
LRYIILIDYVTKIFENNMIKCQCYAKKVKNRINIIDIMVLIKV